MVVWICGHRHLGDCDYFEFGGRWWSVKTQCFHVQFIPCSAEKSFIRRDDDGMLIALPEIYSRSVGWAWGRWAMGLLTMISFLCAILGFVVDPAGMLFVSIPGVIGLIGGIVFYVLTWRPKAAEERKQALIVEVAKVYLAYWVRTRTDMGVPVNELLHILHEAGEITVAPERMPPLQVPRPAELPPAQMQPEGLDPKQFPAPPPYSETEVPSTLPGNVV